MVSNGPAAAFTRNLDLSSFEKQLVDLEEASAGRLGVAFLDTASGVQAGHRTDERFPMCSTFKLLAVAAVLAKADQDKEQLERSFVSRRRTALPTLPPPKHMLMPACRSKSFVPPPSHQATIRQLIRCWPLWGAPKGLTAFASTLGDEVTRLDRIEPDLNEALPVIRAIRVLQRRCCRIYARWRLATHFLRLQRPPLTEWLIQNKTGDKRLRAGLPTGWKSGDKTGSGARARRTILL